MLLIFGIYFVFFTNAYGSIKEYPAKQAKNNLYNGSIKEYTAKQTKYILYSSSQCTVAYIKSTDKCESGPSALNWLDSKFEFECARACYRQTDCVSFDFKVTAQKRGCYINTKKTPLSNCPGVVNYMLDRTECPECKLAKCNVCSKDMKSCISCSVGWGRNKLGSCTVCENNCDMCATDVTMCTECIQSNSDIFEIIKGKCVSRCTNCLTCTAKGCTTCLDGFGQDKTRTKNCKSCIDANCNSCNSDFEKCMICKAGFQLNSNGICEISCNVPNCQTCSSSNNCSACANGYYRDTSTNPPTCKVSCNVPNCQTCLSSNNCSECATGYYRDTSTNPPTCKDIPLTYNCEDRNPCTPANIEKNLVFFANDSPYKFVQCEGIFQCFVMLCMPGYIWNNELVLCAPEFVNSLTLSKR